MWITQFPTLLAPCLIITPLDGAKGVIGCAQTNATTPNIVGATMSGVIACVLAVVCKRMQQLPNLQCIVGRIQPISLCKLCVISVRGPNNVGRAVQRIQHCCATLRRSRNKTNVGSCWLKSLTGFKLCATTRNNMQQGVQTDATCNIQQCWELLANNVASVCTGP